MHWHPLTSTEDLQELDQRSMSGPVLLFKHSIRCSISSAAKARLERAWTEEDEQTRTAYHLDLINHRTLSNAIAERYGIEHASPQALIIHRGTCVHDDSHFGITYERVIHALTRS
jgi:bacillithiol system protein YtxJ